MSKKYIIIVAIQFIVMAMCLIFASYQRTLAETAHMNAQRNEQLAKEHEGRAQAHSELERDTAVKLAECQRALQECRGTGK
jgi:hypothetical protein